MGIKISVIIPTLNEEENLGNLLDQLVSQINQPLWVSKGKGKGKGEEVELIVSDGGSNDNTLKLCAHYPVKVVHSSPGRGKQLNMGATRAQGEILLFLHADSQVSPGIFLQLAKAVTRGAQWGCFTLAFQPTSPLLTAIATASNMRAKWLGSCYGDQGIFCSASAFDKAGGFPNIPLMEDVTFSRIMRRQCLPTVLPLPLYTSNRRFQQSGTFRTICRIQILKLLFLVGVPPTRLARIYGGRQLMEVANEENSCSGSYQGTSGRSYQD